MCDSSFSCLANQIELQEKRLDLFLDTVFIDTELERDRPESDRAIALCQNIEILLMDSSESAIFDG